MNKTVREASKIGPCAEHSRHPSIEAIDAAENHSGLVEMPASRSNGRKLLLTSDGQAYAAGPPPPKAAGPGAKAAPPALGSTTPVTPLPRG